MLEMTDPHVQRVQGLWEGGGRRRGRGGTIKRRRRGTATTSRTMLTTTGRDWHYGDDSYEYDWSDGCRMCGGRCGWGETRKGSSSFSALRAGGDPLATAQQMATSSATAFGYFSSAGTSSPATVATVSSTTTTWLPGNTITMPVLMNYTAHASKDISTTERLLLDSRAECCAYPRDSAPECPKDHDWNVRLQVLSLSQATTSTSMALSAPVTPFPKAGG